MRHQHTYTSSLSWFAKSAHTANLDPQSVTGRALTENCIFFKFATNFTASSFVIFLHMRFVRSLASTTHHNYNTRNDLSNYTQRTAFHCNTKNLNNVSQRTHSTAKHMSSSSPSATPTVLFLHGLYGSPKVSAFSRLLMQTKQQLDFLPA